MMENETASTTKSDPIIIEQPGMRMTVAHRQGLGGSDEGLTFDITTSGQRTREKEFCASIASTKPSLSRRRLRRRTAVYKMKDEGMEDSVRWTLTQLKTRFPAMVNQAGYEEIAERIDQQAIADHLTRLEPEILAKY